MKDDWKTVGGRIDVTPADVVNPLDPFNLAAAKMDELKANMKRELNVALFSDGHLGIQAGPAPTGWWRERLAELWFYSRVRRYLLTLWDAVRGRIDYYDYE